MPNKEKRYEAAVKLSNNKVVVYHNINTGLKKFDRFIKDKFKGKYLFYTVRRKENKEIIGTFKSDLTIQVKSVKIYLPMQRNVKNSGYYVRIPFEINQALINRNLFFSDKIILSVLENYIVIPEDIFNKAIHNAVKDIEIYYTEKNHTVAYDEIKLGEFELTKVLFSKKTFDRTEPLEDYP